MDSHKHEELRDELLEREIEAALDVDPSPEFLARVRTRISDERVQRWPWPGPWAWASAAVTDRCRGHCKHLDLSLAAARRRPSDRSCALSGNVWRSRAAESGGSRHDRDGRCRTRDDRCIGTCGTTGARRRARRARLSRGSRRVGLPGERPHHETYRALRHS